NTICKLHFAGIAVALMISFNSDLIGDREREKVNRVCQGKYKKAGRIRFGIRGTIGSRRELRQASWGQNRASLSGGGERQKQWTARTGQSNLSHTRCEGPACHCKARSTRPQSCFLGRSNGFRN